MPNLFSQTKLKLKQLTKLFNKYFVNIVKNLGILTKKESAAFLENNFSEVEMALKNTKTTLL